MRALGPLFLILGASLAAHPAGAQQRPRYGTTAPAAPPAERQSVAPTLRLSDGTVLADFGSGYERVIRSCSAHGAATVGGTGQGVYDPAPQGGANAAPPGASGLPPVPGAAAPRATASTTARPGSTSSLKPLHGGWRRAGPAYYEGACYVVDRTGRLRLIRL